MPRTTGSSPDDHEADQALRDARARFVAGFTQRHRAMGTLLDSVTVETDAAALAALSGAAHKMAGLSGVLGFPTVSEHASALEVALLATPPDVDAAAAALSRMAASFTNDLTGKAPSWAFDATASSRERILLVEDDPEQRDAASSGLRAAGYRVVTAESGTAALETALAERPDLIVLDVDLPELDGMAVCRQLKLNAAVSSVPIIFCTARAGLMDRMAGLSLGADDYVTKPFAPGELLLRIRRLLARPEAGSADTSGVLTYELFVSAANEILAQGGAAVVMVRVARADLAQIAERLASEMRRKDAIGRLNESHLVLIAPGQSAAEARLAVVHALEQVKPRLGPVDLGVAAAKGAASGPRAIEALIADADLALAQGRVARSGDSGKTTVLLAEDDPDVLHIIDTRLRAAGYRTVMSLDGEQTLAAIDAEEPAVLLLDLMMPKLTGFDVLMRLRSRTAARPRTIVLSARGRDEDITRAFDLGADDYVTKPFNPDELVARIARLTR